MAKTFFIPNKESILGQQEVLTAKSILALVEGLESHSYDAVYLRCPNLLDRAWRRASTISQSALVRKSGITT